MNSLDWLKGCRFQQLHRREYDWVLSFEGNAHFVITCLWRLLEQGTIKVTSEDDGQQFGLPAPVDAAGEVNRLLPGTWVDSVKLNDGTLDVDLRLSNGMVFQILPDSGGYESWTATNETTEFIAMGGGMLSTIPARRG